MFAKTGRLSILHLMWIISLVAIDCGLLRASWDSYFFASLIMTLPILNIMLLAIPKLRRGQVSRLFWIAFDAIGVILLGLIFFLNWYDRYIVLDPMLWLINKGWISAGNDPTSLAIECTCVVAIYAPPQFLLAWLGGCLNARYRVVIERRSHSVLKLEPSPVVES